MLGIELNQNIFYKYASLRYFIAGEHHISRVYPYDVLLLVFDGVLRFTEDGVPYEIGAGQYHIQRKKTMQTGHLPSDSPKYLYVHFLARWSDSEQVLPKSGYFDYAALKNTIEQLDMLSHSGAPYILQTGKFYELLSMLYQKKPDNSLAHQIANYIETECHHRAITLELLCDQFHFSKNHIINVFRRVYGMTPIAYTNYLRLKKAEYLIEVTSNSLESISVSCGFQNYSHFYKLFVRKNHISPDSWRERKRLDDQTIPK